MMVITSQRGFARRIVAIALFALIPLAFGVLALVVPRDGQNDATLIPAPEAPVTLLRQVPLKGASGAAATQPTSHSKRVERGSR